MGRMKDRLVVERDALAAKVADAKVEVLTELEFEIRDARTLDKTTQATICAIIRGRVRRLRTALTEGTEG